MCSNLDLKTYIDFQKGTNAFAVFQDFWKLNKDLLTKGPKSRYTDVFWNYAVTQAEVFAKTHDFKFESGLASKLLDELERRHKEGCYEAESFAKGSEMFNMLGSYWDLTKNLVNMGYHYGFSDAFWEYANTEAETFSKRSAYANGLVHELLNMLQREHKEYVTKQLERLNAVA